MVGYKCQLSVKILTICQLSVTLIHTLFKTLARIVVDLRAGLHLFFFNQYLSRGIQFSRASCSLNGALTQHKNKDIKTLKLNN